MLASQYLRLATQIICKIFVFCFTFSTRLPLIQLYQSINWGIFGERGNNNRDDMNQKKLSEGIKDEHSIKQ